MCEHVCFLNIKWDCWISDFILFLVFLSESKQFIIIVI
jgi:hypothetical protein